jgi:hypothetical protein
MSSLTLPSKTSAGRNRIKITSGISQFARSTRLKRGQERDMEQAQQQTPENQGDGVMGSEVAEPIQQ